MITVCPQVLDTMIAHARASRPIECAGLLLGIRRTVTHARSLRLSHADPHRYSADPLDLARAEDEGDRRGLVLLGYYHSHGDDPPIPSRADIVEIPWPGCGPDVRILISVGRSERPAIQAFSVCSKAWIATPLKISGSATEVRGRRRRG